MSGQPIDIRPDHEALVRDILRARLPKGVRVWAFGSRAKWLAKPYSDLDLALEGDGILPGALVADLAEDFRESDLPWKVDVLDLNAIAPSFRDLIDKDRVAFSLGEEWQDCRRDKIFITLEDLIDFNPAIRIPKGQIIAFVDMASLPTADRYISITTQKAFSSSGSKFEDGDTLFARITPCLENGKGGFVHGLGGGMAAFGSTEFIVLRAKCSSDEEFTYYVSRLPDFRKFAKKQMSGTSGRQRVSWQSLKDFEIFDFSAGERAVIASILGSLDDKIDLNRRMNETLEAMARAIFKDWFVDFGPTRAKMEGREPYLAPEIWELFPERLDEDGRPEGWKTRPLDQIGDFLNGLALQKFPAEPGNLDLPAIKIAELRSGVSTKSNRASTEVPDKYVIGNGDFIFSWSGSLLAKFWTGGAGALNQHLFKVTSESHPMWFVSEWVQSHLEDFQRIAASKAVTMGHIKRSHLSEAMCVCPPDESLTDFGMVIGPLIAKQIANDEESQTLAALRDLLLPKLMSGEIRVRDAERPVEYTG